MKRLIIDDHAELKMRSKGIDAPDIDGDYAHIAKTSYDGIQKLKEISMIFYI